MRLLKEETYDHILANKIVVKTVVEYTLDKENRLQIKLISPMEVNSKPASLLDKIMIALYRWLTYLPWRYSVVEYTCFCGFKVRGLRNKVYEAMKIHWINHIRESRK